MKTIITEDILKSIENCVLCWLATSDTDNFPNVSPKEIFEHHENNEVVIANIASPQTEKNILANNQVCLSFVDILTEKGFQLKGHARVVYDSEKSFDLLAKKLIDMTGGNYPFRSLTIISVTQVKPIIAPGYMFFPEITIEERKKNARASYGL